MAVVLAFALMIQSEKSIVTPIELMAVCDSVLHRALISLKITVRLLLYARTMFVMICSEMTKLECCSDCHVDL